MIYTIGGNKVECVTISKLTRMCGRKPGSLLKLEERGILPKANFRGAPVKIMGTALTAGYRLYTKTLADEIALIFNNEIRQGVKISDSVKSKLIQLFAEERKNLLSCQK